MEKRFNNVFELLAEAERNYAGLVEHELLQNWYLIDTKLYKLGVLNQLFAESRLRLVPKTKKKVEGWVFLEPDYNRPPEYAPYIMPSHRIYKEKSDAQKCVVGERILAKITFEVEE